MRTTRPPGWVAQALLVAKKDLAIELATREIVTTSAFFALLVAIIASLAFYAGPESRRAVAPGALWTGVAFAAVLAVGRTWQREREESALAGLLSLPLSRSAIFAGKAIGVAIFLALVEAFVVPAVALFFSIDLTAIGLPLALICAAAMPGIAASGTLFGAMTARTRARDLMLASVLFPFWTPSLIASVVATRELVGGAKLSELGDYFGLLGVFGVVFVAGGLGLFGLLIED